MLNREKLGFRSVAGCVVKMSAGMNVVWWVDVRWSERCMVKMSAGVTEV